MARLRVLQLLTPLLLGGCRTGLQVEDLGEVPATTSDTGTSVDAAPTLDTASPPGIDAAIPPTARDCPPDLPKNGSACGSVGAMCTYSRGKFGPCSDVGTNNQLAYRCEDTGWLEVARCIDRTSCPSTRPRAGEPCTQEGLDCFYDAPTSCVEDALMQCAGGRFLAVNRCGATARGDGPLLATLKDERRLMIDGGAFPVGSLGAAMAGTQLMVGALVRPTPHQAAHRFLAQTAVPRMPARFSPSSDSFVMGEVVAPPRLDFFRDRFLLAYPVSDEADAVPGLVTQVVPLDGSKGSSRLVDMTGVEVGDVAIAGPEGAFVTFRGWLKDSAPAHGATALALDLEGKAIGAPTMLANELAHTPFGVPVKRAYAHVARWKGGYVFVAPTPATGDLWDDSGVGIWFAPLGATRIDDKPKTIVAIGDQDVALTALSDGSAVIAYASDPRAPGPATFHLLRIMPDGSQVILPPETSERVDAPVVPALVAREDGFALAWIASVPSPADGVVMHVALRTRDGLGGPASVLRWPIEGADPTSRPELLYAPIDGTLHVLWTEGSPSRVYRERLTCPPFGLD
ncbi:MAG: hypothetical protein ABI175_02795 [Polyangiales bacterium]